MKKFILVSLTISLLLTISACSNKQHASKEKNNTESIGVKGDNKLLQYFKETHKDKKVLKAEEDDIDGDGIKDLVVIFNESKDNNKMVVIVEKGDRYEYSNEVAAPISNQKIEFKDIDNKPPMEIVVSGSRGNKLGYAIFRLENMKLIDLFGEGMKNCC